MGYDATVHVFFGVQLMYGAPFNDKQTELLKQYLKLLFPNGNLDDILEELGCGMDIPETKYKIMSVGDFDDNGVYIYIKRTEINVVKNTDKPKTLSPPTQENIDEFVQFLTDKNLPSDYNIWTAVYSSY